jgi:hypothetical protein
LSIALKRLKRYPLQNEPNKEGAVMEFVSLKCYLAQIKMTLKEFAELVGVSRNYLSAVDHGRRSAGKNTVKKVFEITDGNVLLKSVTKRRRKKSNSKQEKGD